MMTKQKKSEIIEKISNKEEKIFVSILLDKLLIFEKNEKLEYTNFLNTNELNIAIAILNKLKASYFVYKPVKDAEKSVIFFIPSYIVLDESFFENYIVCIKITKQKKCELKHKDYMGSIYSLGIKNEMIGDIFIDKDIAYVFFLKPVADFFYLNLTQISNFEVELEKISVISDEVKKLHLSFLNINVIVPSLRTDVILGEVYNLSRSEVKNKIKAGELYINSKLELYGSNILKPDDVIAFRKCGKFKLEKIIGKTKSLNLVISINKYN